MKSNYKIAIDIFRARQETLNAYVDDLMDQMCELEIKSNHYNDLLCEYQAALQEIFECERIIADLQPWWRKILGVEY